MQIFAFWFDIKSTFDLQSNDWLVKLKTLKTRHLNKEKKSQKVQCSSKPIDASEVKSNHHYGTNEHSTETFNDIQLRFTLDNFSWQRRIEWRWGEEKARFDWIVEMHKRVNCVHKLSVTQKCLSMFHQYAHLYFISTTLVTLRRRAKMGETWK